MKKTAIYFTHVAAYEVGNYALLCGHMIDQGSDPTFTRFAYAADGNEWGHIGDMRDDLVYCFISVPSFAVPGKTDFYALGREGILRLMLDNQPDRDLRIPRKDRSGYLEGLCVTSDGALLVCGSQKEVLRYAGEQWQAIDEGLYEPFDGQNDSALFAIAETAPGVLLAVGTRGLVVRRVGSQPWQTLDAPTNLDWHAVLPDGAGGAWIAGDGGTLYRLSADAAQWHDHGDPAISTAGFDSLALHKGTLYVTAMNQLLQLPPGQTLQPVDGPFKPGSEFHSVSARGDYLWATGDEHVYRLGPEGWQYFLCPDNA
jgi:hypothetical protein